MIGVFAVLFWVGFWVLAGGFILGLALALVDGEFGADVVKLFSGLGSMCMFVTLMVYAFYALLGVVG